MRVLCCKYCKNTVTKSSQEKLNFWASDISFNFSILSTVLKYVQGLP